LERAPLRQADQLGVSREGAYRGHSSALLGGGRCGLGPGQELHGALSGGDGPPPAAY